MDIIKYIISIIVLKISIIAFAWQPCCAQQAWEFKLTYESKTLINSPFFLFTAADINNNGKKELIVTDFGQTGNHIEEWKQWKKDFSHYKLMILEWGENELKLNFQKQWETSKAQSDTDAQRIFMAYEARQIVPWEIGSRVIVETIPPYIGVEWRSGKYALHEQQGWAQSEPLVGSWAFPWISPSCYQGFPNMPVWPQECLVGIRDFSGNGKPKIITILENKLSFNQYKQTLRVRTFGNGFPIEWEKEIPYRFVLMDTIDRLNYKFSRFIPLRVFRTANWYILKSEENGKGYELKAANFEGTRPLQLYDFFDFYLRKSISKDVEEYWGYRRVELNDPASINFIVMLRKVMTKPDPSTFVVEDIDFPHHEHFLGVGFFVVEDIDRDGLDEVVLVEQTAGKLKFGHETVHYGDVKDYIHILKWDGTKYRDMWVSPPYTKRGTKFMVEDIKSSGKKQLVILSPYGAVQIWERL